MSNALGFRKINEIETQIIINSFSNISKNLAQIIKNFKEFLYISFESSNIKNKFPNIYFLSKDHIKLLKTLNNDKIISAGLYFGFIKKGSFYLSLEGAEFLYNNNILSDFKKIQVNEKGEKSILYGNNILKNMINSIPDSLKRNDVILIFNRSDEIIALAQSRINYHDLEKAQPNEVIIINLTDKGFYLRVDQ